MQRSTDGESKMPDGYDLVVTGADVVLDNGLTARTDLGIAHGRIAAIAEGGSLISRAGSLFDATGLTVLPGVVDAHIHLGHREDITRPRSSSDAESESASAVHGGVTTFVSYLISNEPYLAGVLDEVIEITSKGSLTDFSFHPVISTEEQLAEVEECVEKYGITSFKLFMYNRGGEGKRLGLPDIDDGFLLRLLEKTGRAGAIVCPHCENVEVNWVLRDRLANADPDGDGGLSTWDASRPSLLEAEAIHRVATLARLADSAVHIVHCTSAAGVEAAVAQRRLGARLSLETCAQYLTHTVDSPLGPKVKVNPPVRHAEDVETLWRSLSQGDTDTVATDHVHRPVTSKAGGIWKASPGFPGMETLLPVMISEGHHKRGLPLATIARLLSANPARIMGLSTKGSVTIGKDADLAFIDLTAEWTARDSEMHSDAGFSIYDGWRFRGKVVHTLVRGQFALRDGKACEDQSGKGMFVRRTPNRP